MEIGQTYGILLFVIAESCFSSAFPKGLQNPLYLFPANSTVFTVTYP